MLMTKEEIAERLSRVVLLAVKRDTGLTHPTILNARHLKQNPSYSTLVILSEYLKTPATEA